MSEFVVTARKWRPLFFKDVVGQEHITQTLKNAVLKDRIHHAYLFSGPRGVGKTTTARILSRSINCLHPIDAEPCNECENCLAVMDGRSMDIIEIDGASNNSVDDIRKLRESAKYPPSTGKYKAYIIDEVHMLSNAAFNALLKILEEPPPHLLFVFATTEVHKVLPTITSRCQRFDFRRMEIDDVTKQLRFISDKEGITIDEESLITIAKKGDGSMRDSQSIFDQVVSFCGKEINYNELTDALHLIDEEFFFAISDSVFRKDTSKIFELVSQVIRKGYDFQETLQGLLEHLRNLIAVKVVGHTDILETSSQSKRRFLEESQKFTKLDLIRMMNHVSQAELTLKFATQPRIRFELALIQLSNISSTTEIQLLINEIQEIKKKGLIESNLILSEPVETNYAPSKKESTDIREKIKLPEPTLPKISAEDLVKNWDDFVKSDELMEAGIKLNNFTVSLKGNKVTLQCGTDFEKSVILRRLEEIEKIIENKYNLYLKLDVFTIPLNSPDSTFNSNSAFPNTNKMNNNTSIKKQKEKKIADNSLHEVERIIIEEFGADLLMDNSRN